MASKSTESSMKYRLTRCYKEHLIILMNSTLTFGPKIQFIIQIYQTLQVLSLVFISYGNSSFSWSCGKVDDALQYILVFLRPELLAYLFDITIVNCIVLCILIFIEQSCNIFTFYRIYRTHLYETWNENEINKISKSYVVKLLAVIRFMLYRMSFIPTMNVLLTFHPKSGSSSSSETALKIIDLLFYLFFFIHDSLYLKNLSWTKAQNDDLIAAPSYILKNRLSLVTLILMMNNLNYDDNYFLFSIILIASGSYITINTIFHLPYACLNSNIIESTKGVIILWGGITYFSVFLQSIESECSYGILYFIPIPCLIYFGKELCIWRFNKFQNAHSVLSLTQLFHILYKRAKNTAEQDLSELMHERWIIQSFQQTYKTNLYIVFWMCQFFSVKLRYNAVRILLSELEFHPMKLNLLSYINHARVEYLHKAKRIPEENEAIAYLTFSQDIERVLNHDELTCQLFNSLYTLLCSSKPESHKISDILIKLHDTANFTLNLYRYLNKKFNRNSRLTNYYVGFMDFININDQKENTEVAHHTVTQLKKSASNDQDLIYFDHKSAVFFIDLKEEVGKILSVRNPEVIGYSEMELENNNILTLFMEPISYVIQAFLTSILDIWNERNLFRNKQVLYIKNQADFMISVSLRGSTVNLEDGKIVLMLMLKPDSDGKEAAFLSDDGRYIRYTTKNMSNILSKMLKTEPPYIYKYDILRHIGIDRWDSEIEIFKEVNLKAKTITIIKTLDFYMLETSVKMLIICNNSEEDVYQQVSLSPLAKRLRSIRISSVVDQRIYSVELSPSHSPHNNTSANHNFVSSEEKLSIQSASVISRNQAKSSIISFTNRRAFILKLGLILYAIIIASLCTVNVVISKTTVIQVTKNNQILQNFCESAFSMMKIATYSKELYLIDNGFLFNLPREDVVKLLIEEADSLGTISHKLTSNLEVDAIKDKILNYEVEYFEYFDNQLIPKSYSFIEIFKKYVNHALDLSGIQEVNFETNSMMELYINGYGRPRIEVQTQAYKIAKELEYIVDSRYDIINYILLGSTICIMLSVSFLVILPLYKFQILRRDTWGHIYNVSINTLITGLHMSKDRLSTVHGIEIGQSEIHHYSRRECKYRVDKKQVGLYLIVGLLIFGIAMYIFSVYWILAPERSQMLKDTIMTTLYFKLKQTSTCYNLFVLREKADLIQDFQDNMKGGISLEDALYELAYIHRKGQEYDDVSDDIWNIQYDSFQSYSKGYHSYTLYLLERLLNADSLLKLGQNYFKIKALELESEITGYLSATGDIIKIYNKAYEDLRVMYFQVFLSISLMVFIGSALILIIIFRPLSNSFKNQIDKEIEILNYLPIYDKIIESE